MTSDRTLARVVRRETHSPRTAAMPVAVALAILALLYLGTEIVLHLLAQPALLAAPGAIGQALAVLPGLQPSSGVILGGGVVALVGLVLAGLALTPGRLPKHGMEVLGGDRAVVVDNGVIAAAIATRVAGELGMSRDAVSVGVSHRVVDVTLRPVAGDSGDAEGARQIATAQVNSYALSPRPRVRVRVRTDVRAKEEVFS